MTNGNYDRFSKILGKLAYVFDNSAALVTAQQLTQYRTMEQVAKSDQESADLPEISIIAQYFSSWSSAIDAGPLTLQGLVKTIAIKILTSDDFISSLTTVPASSSINNVLTALATEMGAGVDNKTFTNVSSTGLVHFLNQLLTGGASVSWHTAVDGSADYKDSVYVVNAIV